MNEGAVHLSELSLFLVRRALRRNQLGELSFFRDGRALRPYHPKVSLRTLII